MFETSAPAWARHYLEIVYNRTDTDNDDNNDCSDSNIVKNHHGFGRPFWLSEGSRQNSCSQQAVVWPPPETSASLRTQESKPCPRWTQYVLHSISLHVQCQQKSHCLISVAVSLHQTIQFCERKPLVLHPGSLTGAPRYKPRRWLPGCVEWPPSGGWMGFKSLMK